MNGIPRRPFWRTCAVTFAIGCALLWLQAEAEGITYPNTQAGGIALTMAQPYLDAPTKVRAVAVVRRTRNTRQDAFVTVRLFRGTSLRATRGAVFDKNVTILNVPVVARCKTSRPRSWWAVVDGLSRGRHSQAISFAVKIGCT